MEVKDPYNYPSLNRKDLMFLSTINQARDDQKTTTKKFITDRTISSSLYNLDIDGSQHRLFGSRTLSKPDFQNYNNDIEGSMSRQLHFRIDKPEYNLQTKDIEGTKPNVMKDTIYTNRKTDPLVPQYKLPTVDMRPPTPPKFLRDSIGIDDIDGTRPKKHRIYATRNIMDISDIEGSHPKKFKPRTTKYDNIDYSDLTKEQFHTKRVVDPLNPVYDIRDYAGNPIKYGHIEGSTPKELPFRKTGPLSSNLATHDIVGATAGTKGLGPFAQRARETLRNNVTTQDVEGAQVGTIRNGALSSRVTNPLMPLYQDLGRAQKNLRQDESYAEPWKEQAAKRTNARAKPEWMKSTVIPIIEDGKADHKVFKENSSALARNPNAELMEDMAKFYGTRPGDVKERNIEVFKEELNREPRHAPTPAINPQLSSDPAFVNASQKFFGNIEDSKAQWEDNVERFYKPSELPVDMQQQFTMRERAASSSQANLHQGSLYKKNEAAFFGEKADSRTSSRGSVFQKNAAHFHGYETPKVGERPFDIPKNTMSLAENPLAERSMKNMPRDPKYEGNMAKFFGAEQQDRRQTTYAEKLKKFIGS